MKTYWDLSEAERAALSADEVRQYLDAELMLKGVLKVKPLALDPVPEAPEPTSKAFVVRFSCKYGKSELGVSFATLEAAQAFLALRPMRLDSEYLGSDSVKYTSQVTDPEIAEVAIFTEEAKNAAQAALTRAATTRAANEKRTEEYNKAVREQKKALEGVWEDWNACRAKAAKLREVADTFADYERTAGDPTLAAKFLAKVYTPELIAEAASVFGFPVESQP